MFAISAGFALAAAVGLRAFALVTAQASRAAAAHRSRAYRAARIDGARRGGLSDAA